MLELNGEIVGFGACGDQRCPEMEAAGYDGEIGAIYILNVARGRGSGRLLMQQMASLLSERGKRGASVWSSLTITMPGVFTNTLAAKSPDSVKTVVLRPC